MARRAMEAGLAAETYNFYGVDASTLVPGESVAVYFVQGVDFRGMGSTPNNGDLVDILKSTNVPFSLLAAAPTVPIVNNVSNNFSITATVGQRFSQGVFVVGDTQGNLIGTYSLNNGVQATTPGDTFTFLSYPTGGATGATGGTGVQGAEGSTGEVGAQDPAASPPYQVQRPGQTVDLQPFAGVFDHHRSDTTFVFSPGDGIDVIHGFKVRGAGHDTLDLSGADFNNSIADVLRHTGDVNGSAFITDPVTGGAVRLAGVTTAELKAHPKDFSFG